LAGPDTRARGDNSTRRSFAELKFTGNLSDENALSHTFDPSGKITWNCPPFGVSIVLKANG